jgi:hypothetical protein
MSTIICKKWIAVVIIGIKILDVYIEYWINNY